MSIDFSKAEIGQKVTCSVFGKGNIIATSDDRVSVHFSGAGIVQYNKGGRSFGLTHQTLMLGYHDLPKIDQGELPKPEAKQLEWKGEFVWAYVSNQDNYTRAKASGKNLVLNYSRVYKCYYAIAEGKDHDDCSMDIDEFNYAWEIEDD